MTRLADSFSGAQVLVTGGLGFIGSAITRRLARVADVTVVDSLIPEYGGNQENIAPVRELVNVNISDVRDRHSLPSLVRDKDYIFNMAGQTSHVDSMTDPFTDLEINSRAQLSILEAVRGHAPKAKVVFASTRQLYGRPDYLPVDELHPTKPVDVNGINKLAGEHFHLLYHQVYGIRTAVLRLTNTYGPGMRIVDARQTFVGIWIRSILQDCAFEVWGGAQLRDFNYVEDVVDAFLMVAMARKADGEIYNLGSREVVSLTQLAELLTEIAPGCEYATKEFPDERKSIDIGDYYSDHDKIENELGWQPRTMLRQGLASTLAYYRAHQLAYL